ncbi:MAG: CDP-diacylglycerol--glycerol-3-phosphate 3-phosphatidyltransferase [Bryobacteraceae bacterium]|nr:CDP-diacylglycerol--glycerol-3-phosphate 3-phosphatidyltransferase [Bryobacteraceae bacterium]
MNLPNALTLVRIFFIPLLVAALVQQNYTVDVFGTVLTNEYVALVIFLIAAFTDLLDGYLARRWRQITTVGTLLDPIADKLLVSSALISLVEVQALPAWMAIVVIGREFAITGLRGIAAAEGYVIKANDLGKFKLVTQVVALSMSMLSIRWPAMRQPSILAMWLVVTFGVVSAIVYFRKFWHQVDDAVKQRSRRDLMRS